MDIFTGREPSKFEYIETLDLEQAAEFDVARERPLGRLQRCKQSVQGRQNEGARGNAQKSAQGDAEEEKSTPKRRVRRSAQKDVAQIESAPGGARA